MLCFVCSTRLVSILVVVLAGCASAKEKPAQEVSPATNSAEENSVKAPPECLETLQTGSNSVLDEHRGKGVNVPDFAKQYRAASIDPDSFTPVEVVKDYQIGKTALLWFVADLSEVVVNAAVLSDLKVAEVTRLTTGTPTPIGTLGELGRGKISGREMLKFLIHARAIGTYIHIGSALCIEHEEETSAGYVARVSGTHTYFTNKENVDDVHFEFRMGSAATPAGRALGRPGHLLRTRRSKWARSTGQAVGAAHVALCGLDTGFEVPVAQAPSPGACERRE
jgi:hypothetical protein